RNCPIVYSSCDRQTRHHTCKPSSSFRSICCGSCRRWRIHLHSERTFSSHAT
ncbi:hypothetical protein M9458_042509, partial [Cirrhinus mrigala]